MTKEKQAIANDTVVADHTVGNEGCETRKEARKELREDRKKALEARRTFLNPAQTYNEQRKKESHSLHQ